MSEEVGIILREAVPGDAKDILLMMGQVNKETEFLVLDEAELLLPPETLEESWIIYTKAIIIYCCLQSMKGRLLEQHLSRQTVNFVCLTWEKSVSVFCRNIGEWD